MQAPLDQAIAILTGAVGDSLAVAGNALAGPMTLMHRGKPLAATADALAGAYPDASGRVVVLVHGLMATELGFQFAGAQDYGTVLHRARGLTPLRVRYNSGQPTRQTGQELARLLHDLVAAWPVPLTDITLVCHSMGGLVARQACALAMTESAAWVRLVRDVVYLATPHLGAPLERAGREATQLLTAIPDPVARLLGDLAAQRSLGIQQLGDPADLPWLPDAHHWLVASSLAGELQLRDWLGDGMVSVRSALADDPAVPQPRHVTRHTVHGLPHPLLAMSAEVAELLVAWLPGEPLTTPLEEPAASLDHPVTERNLALVQVGLGTANLVYQSVAEVRLGRADQVLGLVEVVAPRLRWPARIIHGVHQTAVRTERAVVTASIGVVRYLAGGVQARQS